VEQLTTQGACRGSDRVGGGGFRARGESPETETRDGYILGEDPNCISRDMNGRLTSNLRLWATGGRGKNNLRRTHRRPAGTRVKTVEQHPFRFRSTPSQTHTHTRERALARTNSSVNPPLLPRTSYTSLCRARLRFIETHTRWIMYIIYYNILGNYRISCTFSIYAVTIVSASHPHIYTPPTHVCVCVCEREHKIYYIYR